MAKALIIKDIISYKNVTIHQLEKELGMSNGALRKAMARDGNLKNETILRLLEIFPDLNEEALRTGSGSLFDLYNPKAPFAGSEFEFSKISNKIYPKPRNEPSQFFKNIQYLSNKSEKSAQEVLNELGVSRIQFRQLAEGGSPDLRLVTLYSRFFNYSMEDMLSKDLSIAELGRNTSPQGSNELIRYEEGTEFRSHGEDRFLITTPYIEAYADSDYSEKWDDIDFVEALPRHTISSDSLIFGAYKSFQVAESNMDNGMAATFFPSDIVTGRRLEQKNWKKVFSQDEGSTYVVHVEGAIYLSKLRSYDFENQVLFFTFMNENKKQFPDVNVNFSDVKELYTVEWLTRKFGRQS